MKNTTAVVPSDASTSTTVADMPANVCVVRTAQIQITCILLIMTVVSSMTTDSGYRCELENPAFMFGQENLPKFAFCRAQNATTPEPDRFPGDVCSSSLECLGGGSCDAGVCQVTETAIGSKCSNQANCTLGQYCDGSKCELTKNMGS